MDIAKELAGAVNGVTSKWAKQRKAEERSQRSRATYFKRTKIPLKDSVFDVLPAAYEKNSDGGKLPAHARQIMYDVRKMIQSETNQVLRDKYFTQTLLPEYIRENFVDWNVVYDPRGEFHEPHTDESVQLGTIGVRKYLDQLRDGESSDAPDYDPGLLYPTFGPANRFGAVLFLEKEGFWPLFRAVKLAERYDLAIMSTKGMSVIASRELVDHVCQGRLPLFILRDCDAAGFTIAKTLTSDSDRYEFDHTVNAIDLGLRKTDADELGLESESFHVKEDDWSKKQAMAYRLRESGATADEIQMIAYDRRRIELNAFPSRVLVDYIERKLEEHGVKKVIPDDAVLESAWRRAYSTQYIKSRFEELKAEADESAADQELKMKTIRARVRKMLKENPAMPWDVAIARLAEPEE